MRQTTLSTPSNPDDTRSGIIYESGITDGYAYTCTYYDADSHTVTIMYSSGHSVRLDAGKMGNTVMEWAARCAECRAGRWSDMRLGPVGQRLADCYVAHHQKASA